MYTDSSQFLQYRCAQSQKMRFVFGLPHPYVVGKSASRRNGVCVFRGEHVHGNGTGTAGSRGQVR